MSKDYLEEEIQIPYPDIYEKYNVRYFIKSLLCLDLKQEIFFGFDKDQENFFSIEERFAFDYGYFLSKTAFLPRLFGVTKEEVIKRWETEPGDIPNHQKGNLRVVYYITFSGRYEQ